MTIQHEKDRRHLAALIRLAVRMDMHEGIDNHFSLTVEGDSSRFIINPYGLHWSEVRASDMILCDTRTGVVDDGRGVPEDTAFQIHAAVHRRNPAARCVLHTHMPYITSLSICPDVTLEMVEQNAMRFHQRIAYVDEYGGLADNSVEGERLAEDLGDKPIAVLRGHGVIVTGPTPHQAFEDLYFLERAARVQVLARSMTSKLLPVPETVVRHTCAQMHASDRWARLHFEAMARVLDREEGDYRS